MMYAFLRYAYGPKDVDGMITGIEYIPHRDEHYDPFSVVFDVRETIFLFSQRAGDETNLVGRFLVPIATDHSSSAPDPWDILDPAGSVTLHPFTERLFLHPS